jgi:hypothetical protein
MLKAVEPQLKATVSGSFHRHMPAIYEAVGELRSRHVSVLSPSDPRIVDNLGEFLFVASDRLRSIRLVQDRHLEAIQVSDFLWVVCPDGYTGPSTCMEIGAAHAAGIPVFATSPALDITLGEYVRRVSSYSEAIETVRQIRQSRQPATLLLDPEVVINQSVDALCDLQPLLLGKRGMTSTEVERKYNSTRSKLASTLGLYRANDGQF